MKSAIAFVDANNWYHNVKRWFKPSNIDIKKLLELISEEKNINIKDIKWFVSMPNKEENEIIYKKQRAFLSHLEKQGIKIITRKLQRLSNKELLKKRQDLIESWDLCKVCKPIIEAGFLDIKDPNQKEKGIDVWIAIDMVKEALQNNLDYCILISGDADFVPALELIKNLKKEVLSVFVPSGYSNELRQKFPYYILKRELLSNCLKDYRDEEIKNTKDTK
jgi:uncharacterized LabA/DUF88 family protein